MAIEAQIIGDIKALMAKVAEGCIKSAHDAPAAWDRGRHAGLQDALNIINNRLEGERNRE